MSTRAKLPRWQCHKQVTAGCIIRIERCMDGGATLYFPDDLSTRVNEAYLERCRPDTGGYWVRYDDDYESYSPQAAFEDGYTLLESDD